MADEKVNVLLVEDEKDLQKLLTKILEKMNCDVSLAVNGSEAVSWFENNRFVDLILMDINMPVMDGLAATKAIRRLPGTRSKNVWIYALTSGATDKNVEASTKAGCNGHIVKPFNPFDLKNIIDGLRANTNKSCDNCYYKDNCQYELNPGRGMICWKPVRI